MHFNFSLIPECYICLRINLNIFYNYVSLLVLWVYKLDSPPPFPPFFFFCLEEWAFDSNNNIFYQVAIYDDLMICECALGCLEKKNK